MLSSGVRLSNVPIIELIWPYSATTGSVVNHHLLLLHAASRPVFDSLIRVGADPAKVDSLSIGTVFHAEIWVDEYNLDVRNLSCDKDSSDEYLDWVIARRTQFEGSTPFAEARAGGVGPPRSIRLTDASDDMTLRESVKHSLEICSVLFDRSRDNIQRARADDAHWIKFGLTFGQRYAAYDAVVCTQHMPEIAKLAFDYCDPQRNQLSQISNDETRRLMLHPKWEPSTCAIQ